MRHWEPDWIPQKRVCEIFYSSNGNCNAAMHVLHVAIRVLFVGRRRNYSAAEKYVTREGIKTMGKKGYVIFPLIANCRCPLLNGRMTTINVQNIPDLQGGRTYLVYRVFFRVSSLRFKRCVYIRRTWSLECNLRGRGERFSFHAPFSSRSFGWTSTKGELESYWFFSMFIKRARV